MTAPGSAWPALPAERIGLCGLLRILSADEAPAARREARDDFVRRFTAAMGYPPGVAELERWYG